MFDIKKILIYDFINKEKLKFSIMKTGENKTIIIYDLGNSESKGLSQNEHLTSLFAIKN